MTLLRTALALGFAVLFASSAEAARLVIVQNSTHARYEDPARVIRARLGDTHEILTVDLTGLTQDQARKRAVAVMESSPDAIVALGDKAVYLADKYMKPVPTLFAMVSNWKARGIDRSRISGVSMELDPETMASQIKMFLPDKRRIGVVYTERSRAYVERALVKAAGLQLTVLPIFVQESEEFAEVLPALAPVLDLYWLVEDPDVSTRDNLKLLMKEAEDTGLVTLCHSPGLVSAGMTMSISPDREEVGRQLVGLYEAVLGGQSPAAMPVAPPAKARITLNRDRVQALGLEIDPMLLGFTDQVDTRRGRKSR